MSTTCRGAQASFSLTYARGGNPFSGNLTLQRFNLNLGIGSSSSTLECDILYNGCGNYSAQPLSLPAVGRAMIFACNNLVYGGIVNATSYQESASGFIAKVTLIDPKKTIENVTVMYKGYYCNNIVINNFINVLPLLEPGVALCPPGEDTQNWPRVGSCGAFGTSGLPFSSPENGVQTLKVLSALGNFSVYTTAGEPLFLDLSQLTAAVAGRAFWSRLSGESSSLLQIIESACDDVACDYFLELIGTTIKVVLIDRSIQPNPAIISSIISTAASTGTLIDGEEGVSEIYEESNRLVIGDNVQYLAEVDATTRPVSMMMGYDSNGNPQRVTNNNFVFALDITPLTDILGIPLRAGAGQVGAGNIVNNWAVTEEEMLCSKTLQMWLLYGMTINRNSLSAAVANALGVAQDAQNNVIKAFNTLNDPQASIDDWKSAKTDIEGLPKKVAKDVQYTKYDLAHKWFVSFINTWYGRKYLLPINNFCAYPYTNRTIFRGEGGGVYFSDFPIDSGYPSPSQIVGGILGLSYAQDTSLFETSDGRISGFVRVNNNAQLLKKINGKDVEFRIAPQEMNAGDYFMKNNSVYVRCSSDGTLIRNLQTGFPEVLIEVQSKITALPFFGGNRQFLMNKGLRAFTCLFGVEKYDELKERDKGFGDVTSFNIYEIESGGGGIASAVIPMRSNVYVYGPWVGRKGSTGSTAVNIKPDLSPWNYNGYQGMAVVGNALANNGLRLSNQEASASFTLAEPPGYNVGYFLQYGILVDSINLTYDGSSGVTTRYSFKTYVPKFGEYGTVLAELVSENNKIRNNLLDQIRKERRERLSAINGALSAIASAVIAQMVEPGAHDMASPGFIIVGGYFDSKSENNNESGGFDDLIGNEKSELSCEELCKYKPKPYTPPDNGGASKRKQYEIGLNTKKEIESSHSGAGFENIAILSFDGLVTPVSTEGRQGKLPSYALVFDVPKDRLSETENKLNKTRPSMPPLFKDGNPERLPIYQKYLNPILTKALLANWDGRGVSDKGFNIKYVSFGTTVVDLEDRDLRDAQTDLGFSALRGPLVLQAWGYDTENKPVPNIIDSPQLAENGIFNAEGTKNKFMTNWLDNPKTWPVGPIDLRWDRERGVWVCPPPDRIVVAQLINELGPYGSAKAILLNPTSSDGVFYENYRIYGPNGENITSDVRSSSIVVSDFLGRTLCTGTKIYAAFNDGKYIVLESSVVNEETCECICSTSDTETQTQTETITETVTETQTETITETITETQTETITETLTETVTETITETETITTETETETETLTETVTETVTETATETVTETATETVTETLTETVTETATETTFTEVTTYDTQPTQPCYDCGIIECFGSDVRPGLLGINADGCLTIYDMTECPPIECPTISETVYESPPEETSPPYYF